VTGGWHDRAHPDSDFDIRVELVRLRRTNPKIGAIASFIRVVRDMNDGDAVTEMSLSTTRA
jgi:molybdopterin synthase catalytic subunit